MESTRIRRNLEIDLCSFTENDTFGSLSDEWDKQQLGCSREVADLLRRLPGGENTRLMVDFKDWTKKENTPPPTLVASKHDWVSKEEENKEMKENNGYLDFGFGGKIRLVFRFLIKSYRWGVVE